MHTLSPPSAEQPVFLKLGGSLITDKRRPETPRPNVIWRLAREIAAAKQADPSLRLVIGHGSGSFGHVAGSRYGTRSGVHSSREWFGYAVTADAAARLNRMVVSALLSAELPVWSIQPGVALRCADGQIVDGPLETIRDALERGLVPLIYGDTALDSVRGGTIASTEEIFQWLAERLCPRRMILAGEVDGVFTGDPQLEPSARPIQEIRPDSLPSIQAVLGASHGTDVTGGMVAKVIQALNMVHHCPGLQVVLCSGLVPGNVQQVLVGNLAACGTVIHG
jgi:isopentenyl phosphate kinase